MEFRSHIDGSKHFFSPKAPSPWRTPSGQISWPFDEWRPYPCDHAYAKEAMERTHRWARRWQQPTDAPHDQALFGIIQGNVYADLRQESAKTLVDLDFPATVSALSVTSEPLMTCWTSPFP